MKTNKEKDCEHRFKLIKIFDWFETDFVSEGRVEKYGKFYCPKCLEIIDKKL